MFEPSWNDLRLYGDHRHARVVGEMRGSVTRSELVRQARQGDRDAFDILLTEVIDRLYRIARLILRDVDRAEDAVQETLVR